MCVCSILRVVHDYAWGCGNIKEVAMFWGGGGVGLSVCLSVWKVFTCPLEC